MVKRRYPTVELPPSNEDWHLSAWMRAKGKRQADLIRDLDWGKSDAHHYCHGRNRYNRDRVNEVAAWLGIRPYELLLSPQEAGRVRVALENGTGGPEAALGALTQEVASLRSAIDALREDRRAELQRPRTMTVTIKPPYIRPERRGPRNEEM